MDSYWLLKFFCILMWRLYFKWNFVVVKAKLFRSGERFISLSISRNFYYYIHGLSISLSPVVCFCSYRCQTVLYFCICLCHNFPAGALLLWVVFPFIRFCFFYNRCVTRNVYNYSCQDVRELTLTLSEDQRMAACMHGVYWSEDPCTDHTVLLTLLTSFS